MPAVVDDTERPGVRLRDEPRRPTAAANAGAEEPWKDLKVLHRERRDQTQSGLSKNTHGPIKWPGKDATLIKGNMQRNV